MAGSVNGTGTATALPALPASAWAPPLDQYRDLVCRDSEAPEAYHWAAIVAMIGQLFGRRVHQYYAGDLYLNFQFILLGPTGIKKSSPLNLAPRLLRELCSAEQVRQLWGISTGEGLLAEFAKDEGTRLLVCLNELRSLFARAQNSGNQHFISILIDLIDAIEQVDLPTKNNPISAVRPFLSMIAAATPESLEDQLGENELYGGLLNRFVPVAGQKGAAQPFPRRPDPGRTASVVDTIDGLLRAYTGPTEIELRENSLAGERWNTYYQGIYERQTTAGDAALAALTAREHTHVRRFSLFFAAIRGATHVGVEDLERALDVMQYVYRVVELCLEPVTINPHARLDARIEKHLRTKAMSKRELHQHLSGRVKSFELRRALDTLIGLGRIIEFHQEFDGVDLLRWAD